MYFTRNTQLAQIFPEALKIIHIYNNTIYMKLLYMKIQMICLIIYSNKKETSVFHGPVSFDPVKVLTQK